MIAKRTIRKNIKNNDLSLDDISKESIDNFKEEIQNKIVDPRQKAKTIFKLWDIVITVL